MIAELAPPEFQVGTSIEAELEPKTDLALDALANSPLRALLYTACAVEPQRAHTPQMLTQTLSEALQINGTTEKRKFAHTVRRTCNDTLTQFGLLTQTTAQGRTGSPVLAYQASPRDLERNLALAGAMLDGDLQLPTDTYATLLGVARTYATYGMATVGMKIYDTLLTAPTQSASFQELVKATILPDWRMHQATDYLGGNGVLQKITKHDLSNRMVEITVPSQTFKERGLTKLGTEGKAIYAVSQLLLRQGTSTISTAALLDEITARYPDIDRRALHITLNNNPPRTVQYQDKDLYEAGQHTRFTLAPMHLGVIYAIWFCDTKRLMRTLVLRPLRVNERFRSYKILPISAYYYQKKTALRPRLSTLVEMT